MFNINNFLHLDALKPAVEWEGFPKYNFVGGHIDSDSIPVQLIRDSLNKIILKEGKTLATYGLESGPQGFFYH